MATFCGSTWPSERTVRSTAANPEARQASPILTPVPKGSDCAWAWVLTHCRWRDQSCVTSFCGGAAWAEASVGKPTSLTAHAVVAAATPVKKSRLSITILLQCVWMEKLSRYHRNLTEPIASFPLV